jgi:hypothetical protein
MKRDPWAKCRINTPEERITYLANWYLGVGRRRGWKRIADQLNAEPEAEQIKQKMRKLR